MAPKLTIGTRGSAARCAGRPLAFRQDWLIEFGAGPESRGIARKIREPISERWSLSPYQAAQPQTSASERLIGESERGSLTSGRIDAVFSSPYLLRMPIDPESISLRPAVSGDEEFLFSLYASSRGDDLRELEWDEQRIYEFLRMQYEAQQRFLESESQLADHQIVLINGERVGRVLVERRDHEIRGIDIALLSEFRNRGVGSWLITQLQSDAARARKPLRLQVIRFSPAVTLFERLGFARTSETGTHYQMEWRADS